MLPYDESMRILADKLRQCQTRQGWYRMEQPLPAVAPLAWLHGVDSSCRLYWTERSGNRSVAGVCPELDLTLAGAESLGETFALSREVLQAIPGAHFYGGMAFTDQMSAQWRAFGYGRFILPRFELIQQRAETVMACNLYLPGGEESRRKCHEAAAWLERQASRIVVQDTDGYRAPGIADRYCVPDQQQWRYGVEQVLTAVAGQTLHKAVLSREVRLKLEHPLHLWDFLQRWHSENPRSYQFALQVESGDCFFGTSPERLFRRQSRLLWTEALAGTMTRGMDASEDQAFEHRLINDDKNRHENALVLDHIRDVLAGLCERLESDREVSVIKLRHIQHLIHRFRGVIRPGITDYDLLTTLHPTPAVGGSPWHEARHLIHTLEPHSRGWYSGVFGSLGLNDTEFAVAIRSGLLRGRQLSLYSGAGIVAGSEPDTEWQELDNKINTALALLDG
ncbi:isochorismate synthase [Kistimonas scapharcae]|uniref:Isochorismate synthase MenF n=1 Tax=Kistimonas scapharcae TaxID=1036133 RepID=A0ABP8V8E1_9GAMM